MTAPSGAAFTAVTINTGSVVLTPGQQYVLFLSTSNVLGQASAAYKYGELTNNTTYPGGQFVYQNNTNFGSLSTASWSSQAFDLAFIAMLSGLLSPTLATGAAINPTNVAAGIDRLSPEAGRCRPDSTTCSSSALRSLRTP